MIVANLFAPRKEGPGPALIVGSERLRRIFLALQKESQIQILHDGLPAATPTGLQALQSVQYHTGGLNIPPSLSPYVFGTETLPPRGSAVGQLIDSVDTVIAEISDRRLLTVGEISLNIELFKNRFVEKLGQQGFDWLRAIAAGEPSGPAFDRFFRKSKPTQQTIMPVAVQLMRALKMGEESVGQLRVHLEKLAGASKQLILVCPTILDIRDDPLQKDRMRLRTDLAAIARDIGAVLFDVDGGAERKSVDEPSVADAIVGAKLLDSIRARRTQRQASTGVEARAPAAERVKEAADRTGCGAATLNAMMVDFARERLHRMGRAESGLYEHYARLAESGDIVGPWMHIAKLIHASPPRHSRYLVLRGGLGELGFLLATSGATVDIAEPDKWRMEAMTDFHRRLHKANPGLGKVKFVHALVPAEEYVRSRDDLADTLVIAVHLIGASTSLEALVASLSQFSHILIEPRTFGRLRSESEYREVWDAFIAAGYGSPELVHAAGIYTLEKRSSAAKTFSADRKYRDDVDAGWKQGPAPGAGFAKAAGAGRRQARPHLGSALASGAGMHSWGSLREAEIGNRNGAD